MTLNDVVQLCRKHTAISKQQPASATSQYGEINPVALYALLANLDIQTSDRFYDLGSGMGQPTLLTYATSTAKQCIGLEIHQPYVDIANSRLQQFQQHDSNEFSDQCRNIQFICADIFEYDYNDATLIYFDGTAFPTTHISALSQRLNTLQQLRAIISLRPLVGFNLLPFSSRTLVPCSWDLQMAYLYSL